MDNTDIRGSVVCNRCGGVTNLKNVGEYCLSPGCMGLYNLPQRHQVDAVNSPTHYKGQFPFEVKDLIKRVLDEYGEDLTPYECYCLGNEIKYRFRAGFKLNSEEDIAKAMKYRDFRKEA